MVVGRQSIGGAIYYFRNVAESGGLGGSMRTGWFRDGGQVYYLRVGTNAPHVGTWGAAISGPSPGAQAWIDGRLYIFNASGHCLNPPPGI
jgi:hypothetical protein